MHTFQRFALTLGAVLAVSGGTVASAVPATATATESAGWQWPMAPPHVVRAFAPPEDPYGPGHRGVDLAGTYGQPVHAAAAGWVNYVGKTFGYGIVVITHGEVRSTYQPVNTKLVVGTEVAQGAVIGSLGFTGSHCKVQCLHWGVLRGDEYLDPLSFLALGPPRLLPYWGTPMPPWAGRETAPASDRTAVRPSGRVASPLPRAATERDGMGVDTVGPAPTTAAQSAAAAEPAARAEPASIDNATKPVAEGTLAEPPASPSSGQARADTVGRVITIGLSLGVGIFAAWLTVALLRRRM